MELRSIKKLNSQVIDQIAAGEVVERPAHLVKELIENALDAHARFIEVNFSDGGLFVSVKDDGDGIHPNELSLSLARHATSKIKDSGDLFSIQTYGFRGEALASIASVSHLTITSRPKKLNQAFRIKSQCGKTFKVEACSGTYGTTVVVDRLFQNVPARLKFLKSESVETLAIKQVIIAQALSNPRVNFRVIYKNRLLFYWAAVDSYVRRAETVFGVQPLYHLKNEDERWTQEVILSPPNKTEKTSKKMKFFVNGRPVEDKLLYGAVMAAHRNLLMHGEYPICVLHFTLPSSEVDVNIHPTKTQVRFRSQSSVFQMTQRTVRKLLEQGPWLDRLGQVTVIESTSQKSSQSPKEPPQLSLQEESLKPYKPINTASISMEDINTTKQEPSHIETNENFKKPAMFDKTSPQKEESLSAPAQDLEVLRQVRNFSSLRVLVQTHKTYIITQSQESIVFIDQHAAHERILFEKIMSFFRKGQVEKQKHLIALSIEMDPAEVSSILLMKKSLKGLGIEVQSSQPNEIKITSSPLMIKEKAIEKAIRQLAHNHVERSEEFTIEKIVSDFSATAACHSAIRAGQVLSVKEMESLLSQMDEYAFSSFCPHGRPVFVEYPISRLEKDFCRTL